MDIDYTPLSSPIDPQFKERFKKNLYPKNLWFGLNPASWVILGAVAAGLVFVGASVYNYSQQQQIIGMIIIAIGLLPLVALIKVIVGFNARMLRSMRALMFTSRNGLLYDLQIKDPKRDGIIFSDPNIKGSFIYDRIYRKAAASNSFRGFEMGNYYYQVGSGDNQAARSHYYGFLSIDLKNNLPHMVLDAAAQKINIAGLSLSTIGVPFKKDQIMKLEGNFNDYFTLYAPKGYETDALYVFTPDLMARFIDYASIFSAEIIDKKLYIYSAKPFFFDKQETYELLFGILDTLGLKVLKQTSNYSDTSAEQKGSVSEAGKRLRKGPPASVYILIVFIVTVIIIANFDAITALFK